MVDVEASRLICYCSPCSTLLVRPRADTLRLVPQGVREITDIELDDAAWQSFRLPVAVAFFFYSTPAQRVVAFHPGRMGATQAVLHRSTWEALTDQNPILATLHPDVEALLVDRSGAPGRHWLVPIDVCYRLATLVRSHWKGFGGGPQVWREIARFLSVIEARARPVSRLMVEDPAVYRASHAG